MNQPMFDEDQFDYLQEIANLAMGQAGADLAKALDVFVELHIPKLAVVRAEEALTHVCPPGAESERSVSIIRMGFQRSLSGEALVVFGDVSFDAVADKLGGGALDKARQRELLLDIGSIIATACLNGLAKNLDGVIAIARPSVLCHQLPAGEVFGAMFARENISWDCTLIIKINFKIENENFSCDLLIFFDEESMNVLGETLNRMIDEI